MILIITDRSLLEAKVLSIKLRVQTLDISVNKIIHIVLLIGFQICVPEDFLYIL